ncbi:hypothetical protein [Nocardia sp. A7]|uniref:hypothetical protein n=1 Tax=Nocardia sp. A7 TaxID=2789274 RepID=UPI00397BCFFF
MREGEEEPGEPTGGTGPRLVVGYTYSDTGARPLAANTVFYASPMIEVSTADPQTGVIPVDVPAGVSVIVQNLSNGPALGTTATFWFARPSFGALVDITRIGTATATSIPPGGADLLTCTTEWTPSADFGTHQCLLVQAECLNDTLPTTPPGLAFRPDLARHVGQRNLTITAHGQPMLLTVSNPFDHENLAVLRHRGWRLTGVTPELCETLGIHPADLATHALEPRVQRMLRRYEVGLSHEVESRIELSDTGNEGRADTIDPDTADLLTQRPGEPTGEPFAEFALPDATFREVELTISSADLGPDDLEVHEFVQTVGNIEVGGYITVGIAGPR